MASIIGIVLFIITAMKRTIIIALAASTLVGCTTVRDFAHEHPVITGVGAALVVGSIAASANHGNSGITTGGAIGDPSALPCTPQPNGSCR